MIPSGGRPELQPDDPLLESLLDEVLGGQTPPDLRARILAHHEAAGGESLAAAWHGQYPVILAPPVQESPRMPPSLGEDQRARRRHFRALTVRRVIVALLTASAVLALVVFRPFFRSESAHRAGETRLARPATTPSSRRPSQRLPSLPTRPLFLSAEASSDEAVATVAAAPDLPTEAPSTTTLAPPIAAETVPAVPPSTADAAPQPWSIVEQIDQQLQREWQLARVEPSPPAPDEEWCQRVYRHLLGRRPSDEELASWLRQTEPERRAALVDRLLTEPRYREEYAAHWSKVWAGQLLGAVADGAESTRTFRAGLERYLQQALLRNLGFDRIAFELLTAQGSNSGNDPDFSGATNYLLALWDERGIQPTTEVCRVLLGHRAQCAQCHRDTQGDMQQDQFWQLTAFFRQTQISSHGAGRYRLTDRDFAGDLVDGQRQPGAVSYQQLDGSWKSVSATLPDGRTVDTSGSLQDASRRRELASWLVASPSFSRALVNRLWSQFFHYGFTSPIDDMGRHNPAAQPELLNGLADALVASDFDLLPLIRGILLSDSFARSQIVTDTSSPDAPADGSVAMFSRAYYRPVAFLNTAQALVQLTQPALAPVPTPAADAPAAVLARQSTLASQVTEAAATSALPAPTVADARSQQLTIGQLRLARSLAASSMSATQKVDHAFLAMLGRLPRPKESQQTAVLCESLQHDPALMLERLFWALSNTAEFATHH